MGFQGQAKCFQPFFPAAFQPLILGFLELAFTNEGISFFRGEGGGATSFFALLLGGFQGLAGVVQGNLCFGLCLSEGFFLLQVVRVLLQLRDADIECRDFHLFLLEEPVGLQKVVHRRHEERNLVFSCQDAGEGGQIPQLAFSGLHHQHAEHLSFIPFGM